ncbi:MAG: DNA translocase FtsK [Clostridiaceae bacterium]
MEEVDQIFLEQQSRLSMLPAATQIVIDRGEVNCFTFQRYFNIGYTCSMRLQDMMEERKILGPRNSRGKHEVLIGWDEFEVMFGPRDAYYEWHNYITESKEEDGNARV